jgi:biotin carboxyl carrier protein
MQVNVKEGDSVEKDTIVAIVEAMKMEHPVKAPYKAVVEEVLAEEGAVVQDSQPLVKISAMTE